MRACRIKTIKLTDANEAFLAFCEAYGTDEQEKLRARYEREDEREKQVAQGTISLLATEPDNDLRGSSQGMLWNLRTSTGSLSETAKD